MKPLFVPRAAHLFSRRVSARLFLYPHAIENPSMVAKCAIVRARAHIARKKGRERAAACPSIVRATRK